MTSFREKLKTGQVLSATWVKTPHAHVVEVLSLSPLDALVIDAEHAPFDRAALDSCVLAARANQMPVLVRPSTNSPTAILQALDSGATGVVVPHVRNADDARSVVRSCQYLTNGRGYAGSTRAAGYTTVSMADHRKAASDVTIVAQIEDAEALERLDEIAEVERIDAIFIGRADLTISLGAETPDDPIVVQSVNAICEAGQRAGKTVGMFLSRLTDIPEWKGKGASLFVLQSDQAFLLSGASALHTAIHN